MNHSTQARILLVTSGLCLIIAPVIFILSALTPSPALIALTLTIIGGIGLFASMRSLQKASK